MLKIIRILRFHLPIPKRACSKWLLIIWLNAPFTYAQEPSIPFVEPPATEVIGAGTLRGNLWVNAQTAVSYSREHFFLDEMRTADAWGPRIGNTWGGLELVPDIQAVLDENGYPQAIPESMDAIATSILFTNLSPPDAGALRGRYRLVYEGTGKIEIGHGTNVESGPGWMEFDFDPETMIGIRIDIAATASGGNHIRNIHVYKLEFAEEFEAGRVVNPLWAERWGNVEVVRFMDHMQTNNGPVDGTILSTTTRPTPDFYSYQLRGSAIEDLIAASNELGFDIWLNIHHLADTAYTQEIAMLVRDTLDPRRHVYWEWSNEIWNWGFPVSAWLNEQRMMNWGGGLHDWMQYGAYVSVPHMEVIAEVFAGQMHRITRVAGLQMAWPDMMVNFLDAPYIVDELHGKPPHLSYDALAVTGYFGVDWVEYDWAVLQEELIDRIESKMYTDQQNYDWLKPYVSYNITETVRDFWEQYKVIARARDLDMLMYEGGTHTTKIAGSSNDALLDEFLAGFSYSQTMADLYAESITEWVDLGVEGGYMQFNTTQNPGPWGNWGALRDYDDSNPRYDLLMDYNNGEFP